MPALQPPPLSRHLVDTTVEQHWASRKIHRRGIALLTNRPSIPAPGLELKVYVQERATVVRCSGRLTADVTANLREQVKDLILPAKLVVLDLTDLQHMDSAGLGTIVALYVSARRANCDLRLINFNKRVRELLGMTNLLSIFEACGQYFTRMP
jgi:anti-sigma B factor antagonist